MRIVAYEESFGQVNFPEGFRAILESLSVEEQTEYYRTSTRSMYSMTGWGERKNEGYAERIIDSPEVTALIVKDNIIVGVMMSDAWGKEVPCFAEKCVCTYYACDNNGAGYKESEDYTYLICVSEGFDK